MASAITPLANITLGSAASTITFSSISQSYRDVFLVVNATLTSSAGNIYCRLNGDSGNNYNRVQIWGTGSSTGSAYAQSETVIYLGSASTISSVTKMELLEYSATDKHKFVFGLGYTTDNWVSYRATRWSNTSAVTSIAVSTDTNSFAAGSTFALYGVSA